MTANITDTTDRQGFAPLVTAFYAIHADYIRQLNGNSQDDIDKAFEEVIAARKALVATPAPDWQGVQDKATVLAQEAYEAETIEYGEIKALLDDIATLNGGAAFNAAHWLYQWGEWGGGYVVQNGNVNLLCPVHEDATARDAQRGKLIAELSAAKGREALTAYVIDLEAKRPADQWQALCNALADNAVKLASKDLKEGEIDGLADEQTKAIQALMLFPAPDAAALAYKLEQFAAHDCGEFSDHIREPILAALIADAKRMAG